jgi:hypothetical protein
MQMQHLLLWQNARMALEDMLSCCCYVAALLSCACRLDQALIRDKRWKNLSLLSISRNRQRWVAATHMPGCSCAVALHAVTVSADAFASSLQHP